MNTREPADLRGLQKHIEKLICAACRSKEYSAQVAAEAIVMVLHEWGLIGREVLAAERLMTRDEYERIFSEIASAQAHQVRGPIASILGLVSLYNHEAPADPINSEIISRIEVAAHLHDEAIRAVISKSRQYDGDSGRGTGNAA
jgi:hypothetical protein